LEHLEKLWLDSITFISVTTTRDGLERSYSIKCHATDDGPKREVFDQLAHDVDVAIQEMVLYLKATLDVE
jgi:hypothetical protein